MKNQLNNKKGSKIKGKSTKIAAAFIQYKPNLKNIKIAISSFETSIYEILPACRGEKANPSKPNLSLDVSSLGFLSGEQTQYKPNQTQFKPEGRRKRWNVFSCLSDFYYRTMRKSRAQIYDELLVIKCRQGNKNAFDELVGRWQKRLWYYAFKVTGSESTAWDIVQETWYGVVKGIRKLEDVDVFPQWVFRIANNKCTDWLRRQRRQQQLNNELTRQTQNESGQKQNGGENTESLRAAIEKLSPDRRALLILRYHEGFDISQIAEILNVPEGTVKSRLHRTVNELRQLSINGARLK